MHRVESVERGRVERRAEEARAVLRVGTTPDCSSSKAKNAANHPVSTGRGTKPGGACRKQQPSPLIAYLYPPAT